MEINDKNADYILAELQKVQERLAQINDMTGVTARVNWMKSEVIRIGWSGVVAKYHPDINCDDPASNEFFTMFKYVYETMKRKGEAA